jgi:hypothetical protein
MPDLPDPATERRHVSRRLFLRGALLVTGGTALLVACAPNTPDQSPQSAAPEQPAEAPKPAAPAVQPTAPTAATAPIVPSVPGSSTSRPGGTPRTGGTLVVAKTTEGVDASTSKSVKGQ